MIDPSVGDWRRIMAAQAHGHSPIPTVDEVVAANEVARDRNELARAELDHWFCGDTFTWQAHPLHPREEGCCAYEGPEVPEPAEDAVGMPSHYTQLPVEAIDITEHFNFCMGNALKYIWRADHKGKPVEDLRKAAWYIEREIERRTRDR